MKKILMAGTAAVAILLATGAAQAADIVPEPVAMTDWSGFYIGGHVGYGWANMSGCYDCNDSSSALFASDLDLEGILGGVHAGYNWQTDSLVFGIEGDVSFTDMNDSGVAENDSTDTQSGDVDLLASVRARLGVAFDDVLLYATGGIAFPDAEWEYDEIDSGTNGNAEFGEIGGVVGGGAEYAVSDAIRLRAEGLYYFFDEAESIEDIGGAQTGEEIEFDDVFVIRGGVSFYFNL
jgi:outer membrane immunogenic protein